MFINLSNHSSNHWSKFQRESAETYGEVIDIPFPSVSVWISDEKLDELVLEYFNKICKYPNAIVMVQGEFVFTFRLITLLKKAGYCVVAAQSERKTIEFVDDDHCTHRRSVFSFARFLEY